jgi:hypothetical protein
MGGGPGEIGARGIHAAPRATASQYGYRVGQRREVVRTDAGQRRARVFRPVPGKAYLLPVPCRRAGSGLS